MFWTLFLLAMAGFLIAFLLSVASFAKSMKFQHNFHTIRDYWKLNAYYDIGGIILMGIVCFLLTVPDSGAWLVSFFTAGQVTNNTPGGLMITAVAVGAANQFALNKLRGIINPKQYIGDNVNTDINPGNG